MNAAHLPALWPLLALAAGALALLIQTMIRRHGPTAFGLALLSVAGALAGLLAAGGRPQAAPPLLVLDGLATFVLGLLLLAALAVLALANAYLARSGEQREEFFLLLLLATLGAGALTMSAHLASLFLGLELLSIALYTLIAYLPRRGAGIEAGTKYLVLTAASTAALLFGMALVYYRLGTLELARLANLLGSTGYDPVLVAGLGLAVVGFGFKLALVPFHLWVGDVYQGAPAPVTAFVATVSKGAVAAVLLRFFLQLGLVAHPWWALVFGLLAAGSMITGNLLALLQDNLKRLLAYSSIAHLGYLLVAALAGGPAAAEAVVFYLVAYFVTMLGAFGVIASLSHQGEELESIAHYRGLGRRRPWLAAVLAAMLLSLAGIPLTAGFASKVLVLAAGVGAGLWLLVMLLVVTSLIGLYAYLRVIVAMTMQQRTMDDLPAAAGGPVGLASGLCLGLLLGVLLWLGIQPAAVLDWVRRATAGLL